ncbi:prepilin-type N-terminal cleavage/methylation domain-containing protein [Deinococcus ruber]|uniref:Prepilin-type N-terminal cleavage/methylation domain-containing protein n=1 Tax=Deinococcus ruber TaxID=1848197 RepID=A0A918KWG5_9DEIO|nr:prepilin-type N-terminal cleavage/methylation domain-containing protein [Deinococcus ruber]GGR36909.1 hypothetical protein GCM10008957_53100 [Deinococcus ruber]
MTHPRHTQGFTLIELLVVIAIIAILAAIFVPSYAAAQKKPRDVAVLQCIKAITGAEISYAGDHNGSYAGTLTALNNTDVTEQCSGIQVHHFDSAGLRIGATGDGIINNDGQGHLLFLAWSPQGSNLYEVNQSRIAQKINPVHWN